MTMVWLKLYMEILDDPLMSTLPDRLWRRVIELFLCAKRVDKDGELPDVKQLAWMLRMQADELLPDLMSIAETGIIQRTETGWFVTNFAKRQDAATSTERSQEFRKRAAHKLYVGDDETEQKRFVAQNRTEHIKTQTKNKTQTQTKPVVVPEHLATIWEEWRSYRKEIKKKLSPRTEQAQLNKLAKFKPDVQLAMIRQSIERGWIGLFEITGSIDVRQAKDEDRSRYIKGKYADFIEH